MKDYYIYIITNMKNGKQYIGQHVGKINDDYLGSGVNLTKAIKKYGKENFRKEILCICDSKEELDEKEKYYIDLYDAVNSNNFYNLSEGGQKGDGWKACQKYFESHPEIAKDIYKKNGERLQEWIKEHPEENKKNIQAMLDGSRKYWEEHPEELNYRMQQLQESKKKWQQEHPEEYKQQIEHWRKKGSEANSKAVICITTDEIFNSISEASRAYNVAQPNISKCLKGERKSAGKHPETGEKLFWKFLKDTIDKEE